MQNTQHSKIVAVLLLGLACFLAQHGYREDYSYAGRLMYIFTGSTAQLAQQYYLGAGLSLALALFWSLK